MIMRCRSAAIAPHPQAKIHRLLKNMGTDAVDNAFCLLNGLRSGLKGSLRATQHQTIGLINLGQGLLPFLGVMIYPMQNRIQISVVDVVGL